MKGSPQCSGLPELQSVWTGTQSNLSVLCSHGLAGHTGLWAWFSQKPGVHGAMANPCGIPVPPSSPRKKCIFISFLLTAYPCGPTRCGHITHKKYSHELFITELAKQKSNKIVGMLTQLPLKEISQKLFSVRNLILYDISIYFHH